ncbi:ELO family [Dillenia turbinata]|uniref:ELO family n=1 Tax=Dillenia turbinata TaxID=194707 RepID=A0AAN8VAQ4_9MAGN
MVLLLPSGYPPIRSGLLLVSMLTCMSFLWLEFSQSFQVLAILSASLVYFVVYGYRFWIQVGLPGSCFPIIVVGQVVLLGCNLACHIGVLLLHLLKGGCNGIGAWIFNSVLNCVILLFFLNFFVKKMHMKKDVPLVQGVVEDNGRCKSMKHE